MIIETTLLKILNKDAQDAFKKSMTKWPETADVFSFIKIANEIESCQKDFNTLSAMLVDKYGFQIGPKKSANANEITDFLLGEYGRQTEDGRLTIIGAPESNSKAFFAKKEEADRCILKVSEELEKALNNKIKINVPKKIKVLEKHLRKEIVSVYDCFILEPFLDLSEIEKKQETTEQ